MDSRSYYRFAVIGPWVDRLRELGEIEGVRFSTPFMAYFPSGKFPKVDNIKAGWSRMEIKGLYNLDGPGRDFSVAPLAIEGTEVHTENFDDLPFLMVMEAPPMTSSGLSLFNAVRDVLMETPDVQLYVPD